jgi:hypothetical protein
MQKITKAFCAATMVLGSAALAQDSIGPKPDPTHIPFILPKDIPWKGFGEGSRTYTLFGDVNKPGPYALLLMWPPHQMSKPHFHQKLRYITVLSGHWWVSSSNVYNPSKTYPLPPGTLVQDMPNTVHWDGAKDEPVVLQIMGDGPAPNINVDEHGKPLPADGAAAAGKPGQVKGK